jgi:hypothetical protein
LLGKDGELGRIRKEIAKEDVLSMKEAWKDGGENEIAKKEGKERRVTEGVLMSLEVRETHPLKILLGNVQVEDVESLPGVVDGDRVVIIPKGNYSKRGIRDGRHWMREITTSLKTRGGEAVRNWRSEEGGGAERRRADTRCRREKRISLTLR